LTTVIDAAMAFVARPAVQSQPRENRDFY
jgi:hypothetical protein